MSFNHLTPFVIVAFLALAANSDPELKFLAEPITKLVKLSEGRGLFRCEASPPGAEIQWLYKGGNLPQSRFIKTSGQKLTVLLGKMDNSSRSAHFYDFLNDAYFQCEIRFRGKAKVSLPAQLIVAVMDEFPHEPHLHISAVAGNTAIIPCDPPHSIPTVVTEFLFNDKMINRSTDNKYIMPSGDLQIFNVKPQDSGEYQCIANNPYLAHRVKSKRKVFLHVEEQSEFKPVSFVKSPQSKVYAALGRNLTLECVAVGYPIPVVTWKRSNRKLSESHYQQHGGNLHIISVKRGDEGTYTCEASDSMGNKIVKSSDLEIQETPQITKAPNDVVVEIGGNFSLTCHNRGHPKPVIKWIHNGIEILDSKSKKGHQLIVTNVNQKDAGIYQCLALNDLGTDIASATVTINSGNTSSDSDDSIEYDETRHRTRNSQHSDKEKGGDNNDHEDRKQGKDSSHGPGKRHHKRKHSKGVRLIPPSKPEINRLSNTSVMVRWTVGEGGLPINFFKLQYKEVGRHKTNWMTIDEDIAAHIHSYAVTSLKTGGAYRFRIAAVYSNSDNRDGPISDKFVLTKDTPIEKPSAIPIITFAEAESPSAITLQWEYQDMDTIQTVGFFIHYRATHMAGKYLKVSVLGSNTRSHTISHLLPETGYDIKMQSFNRAGTSDFSNIVTRKTKESEDAVTTKNRNRDSYYNEDNFFPSINFNQSISSKNADYHLLYIILGVVFGLSVLVVFVCVVRVCRQKQITNTHCDDSNSKDEPLKINGNGHINGNGYISVGNKINININPLSQLDLDNSEKTDDMEEMISNNNEIIRLRTFNHCNGGNQEESLLSDIEREQNNINSEIDRVTSVIIPNSLERNTELPEDV